MGRSVGSVLGAIHPLIWLCFGMLAFWGAGILFLQNDASDNFSQIRNPTMNSILITVRDLPNGSVGVFHTNTNTPLARYESGEGSFVRTIFRSLVRDRKVRQIDADPVFRLHRLSDGAVMVEDSSTGSKIQLDAFGDLNSEQFRSMLQAAEALAGSDAHFEVYSQ